MFAMCVHGVEVYSITVCHTDLRYCSILFRGQVSTRSLSVRKSHCFRNDSKVGHFYLVYSNCTSCNTCKTTFAPAYLEQWACMFSVFSFFRGLHKNPTVSQLNHRSFTSPSPPPNVASRDTPRCLVEVCGKT